MIFSPLLSIGRNVVGDANDIFFLLIMRFLYIGRAGWLALSFSLTGKEPHADQI